MDSKVESKVSSVVKNGFKMVSVEVGSGVAKVVKDTGVVGVVLLGSGVVRLTVGTGVVLDPGGVRLEVVANGERLFSEVRVTVVDSGVVLGSEVVKVEEVGTGMVLGSEVVRVEVGSRVMVGVVVGAVLSFRPKKNVLDSVVSGSVVKSGICVCMIVDCLLVGSWVGGKEDIWLPREVGDAEEGRPQWAVWALVLVENLTSVFVAVTSS